VLRRIYIVQSSRNLFFSTPQRHQLPAEGFAVADECTQLNLLNTQQIFLSLLSDNDASKTLASLLKQLMKVAKLQLNENFQQLWKGCFDVLHRFHGYCSTFIVFTIVLAHCIQNVGSN
jgi:hypothetical protein